MRRLARFMLGSMLALTLCGAHPTREITDRWREAEAAVTRGDWDLAGRLFTELEPLTDDPGLVAFNRGVIDYRRGNYRQAETHWRRALADAAVPPERRSNGLFNLADALVKQAGNSDAKQLQAAIECYELVLREATDDGLKSDAGHNLEVAKLLWAVAISRQPPKERDPGWENPETPERKEPPAPKPDPKKQEPPGPGDQETPAKQKTKAEPTKEKPAPGQEKKETTQQTPGSGSLKVINDDPTGPAITAEDANATLRRTADRLRRERQKLREESSQGERFRPNDW